MDLMRRRREILAQGNGLPSAYRRVEYIQTLSGGTHINSGIAMSEDLVFEIDFQLVELRYGNYFMGVYNGTSFYLYVSPNTPTSYFQTQFGSGWQNTSLAADVNRHKFIYTISNGRTTVKEGNVVIFDRVVTTLSDMGILVAGTYSDNGLPIRTFSSKMTKNGVVIQNLIPCVRKSDSEAGMYDTVSKTFYTNAGTGSFIIPT